MPGTSAKSRAKPKRKGGAKPASKSRAPVRPATPARRPVSKPTASSRRKPAAAPASSRPAKGRATVAKTRPARVRAASKRLTGAARKGIKQLGALAKLPISKTKTRLAAKPGAKASRVTPPAAVHDAALPAAHGRPREHRAHGKKSPHASAADGKDGAKPARPRGAASRKDAARRAKISATTDWEELMAMADMEGVRPYRMHEAYAKGDVIRHKFFGLGIVVREVNPQKIDVSFKEGVKRLACSWR
jgi:hypothetical protein